MQYSALDTRVALKINSIVKYVSRLGGNTGISSGKASISLAQWVSFLMS